MLDDRNRRIFEEEGGADFSYTVDVEGVNWRFRVNMLKQLGRPGLVARRINILFKLRRTVSSTKSWKTLQIRWG